MAFGLAGPLASVTVTRSLTPSGYVYTDRRADIWRQAAPLIRRDLLETAPKFRIAVADAMAQCALEGWPVAINEARRTDQLQRLYFSAGRDAEGKVINRKHVLTGARSALWGWHFYGLAIDVKHPTLAYKYPKGWLENVARTFKAHGLAWGGDWKSADLPHFQWGKLKPSPSDRARELYFNLPTPQWHGLYPWDIGTPQDFAGCARVWEAVGAIDVLVASPLYNPTPKRDR